MGSSTKRRKKDIANPGTIQVAGSQTDSNEKCPVSFRIKLETKKIPEETTIYLKLQNQIVSVFAGSTKITDISGNKNKLMSFCLQIGFTYTGKYKKGYGEFTRAD